MFKFQKLSVWHKAVELNKICLKIADDLPNKYQFSFVDQLRRAVLSVANNIAEGSGRSSLKDQANFYNMAKGSVYEVINILVIMNECGLFKMERVDKEKLYKLADEICMMLTGLMRRK